MIVYITLSMFTKQCVEQQAVTAAHADSLDCQYTYMHCHTSSILSECGKVMYNALEIFC